VRKSKPAYAAPATDLPGPSLDGRYRKDDDGNFIGQSTLNLWLGHLLIAFSRLLRRSELALLRRAFSSEEPAPTWLENAV
jgi:hypothetical protein